jgi:3'-phosphoadenosine 5'-phosphosulfate sulfotransferase (PAPS reductase)/FAD synthetase
VKVADPDAGRRRGPDELVAEARRDWNPIKTFCLFSGGGDSTVLAHRCRDLYDELFYIDTGTAVPTSGEPSIGGVEEHVRAVAASLGKPLTIRRSGDAYRTLVLGDELWWRRYRAAARDRGGLTIEEWIGEERRAGRTLARRYGRPPGGFPGPGFHGRAYKALKEARIEELLRETKAGHPRTASVLFLSGIRRSESRRRSKREPLSGRRSAKFCAPLIDWTGSEMAAYRDRFELPTSDAAALLHRSGECNCGAFARADEERGMMRTFWPAWWSETIEALESEAEALGIRWCRWGGFDVDGNRATGSARLPAGSLCSRCVGGDGGGGGRPGDVGPDAGGDAGPDAGRGAGTARIADHKRACGGRDFLKSPPQSKASL